MKKKFVEVEGTIKVKIKKKFVAFLWGGTLLLAQDVILIVVVMAFPPLKGKREESSANVNRNRKYFCVKC